jgi:hypothetical protein
MVDVFLCTKLCYSDMVIFLVRENEHLFLSNSFYVTCVTALQLDQLSLNYVFDNVDIFLCHSVTRCC